MPQLPVDPRSMTAAEIAAALAEVAPRVVGGVIVKVREPWDDHLALSIRKEGRNVELLVGVTAGLARIHRADDLPPARPRVSPFTLRARKLLRPARVTALEQVPGERVVTLAVSRHRDAEGPWETRLVAELFGRGRMFLLDDGGRVLAWTGPGGPRGLTPATPYAPPPSGPRPGAEVGEDLPVAGLEARYRAWMAAREARDGGALAEAARRRERRRIERRIAAMERDLAALADFPAWRREGELLAAHRHLLARGLASVTVTDWFTEGNPERALALDPAKTPEENIEARFRRARRAERGIPVLTGRLEAARAERARLEAAPLEAPDVPARPEPRSRERALAGLRRYDAGGGWEVLVGRGAAENERLTFRVARGNDLWLHARGVPGAHVVLRGEGEPPPSAVRAAALLAAHFSRLKGEGGGEVIYTPRKFVRRLKGGRPGQVAVEREKVLWVTLEGAEAARLLATRKG
jgi:predicted ribosome quality control (RQC) complex YloA/Tae2 family protein